MIETKTNTELFEASKEAAKILEMVLIDLAMQRHKSEFLNKYYQMVHAASIKIDEAIINFK